MAGWLCTLTISKSVNCLAPFTLNENSQKQYCKTFSFWYISFCTHCLLCIKINMFSIISAPLICSREYWRDSIFRCGNIFFWPIYLLLGPRNEWKSNVTQKKKYRWKSMGCTSCRKKNHSMCEKLLCVPFIFISKYPSIQTVLMKSFFFRLNIVYPQVHYEWDPLRQNEMTHMSLLSHKTSYRVQSHRIQCAIILTTE